MIGESYPRIEDDLLLRGEGQFVADLNLPHQLHMRVVRSNTAHGLLRGVDTSSAIIQPGVAAVWTGADVADIGPIDFRQVGADQMVPYRQPILAQERVRYVGEPIAVVFADNAYLAEDAAEMVVADIEELEALVDVKEALGEFDFQLSTEAYLFEESTGDIDIGFAESEYVQTLELTIGRHSGVPLECRGALAVFHEDTKTLEFLGAAKVPFQNRDALANMLGLLPDQIVLHESHVGGGFGVRGELYPEDVLVALAATRLDRPIKWIEDRQEHLVAANRSRDQSHSVRFGFDQSGVIKALEVEFFSDQGAYVRTHGATVPTLTAAMLPGPYRIPNYRVIGHVRLSNKTPAGTYRSPGRYEGTFVRERILDAVSSATGLDRLEVRLRNFISPEEMPFDRQINALGTPVVYDSGDYEQMLRRMVRHIDNETLTGELKERRSQGEMVGIGYGFFVEKSGLGPYAGARVEVRPDGRVWIITGDASVGQGIETVMAQICNDVLRVGMENISVVHGQTDEFPRGLGAFASRVTAMTGSATYEASLKMRDRIVELTAEILGAEESDIEFDGGYIGSRGKPEHRISFGELTSLSSGLSGRTDDSPELVVEEWFESTHMSYPYGFHIAVVRIDPETGEVFIERYLVSYDMGRAVNPMLIEGQVLGGVAQGIGGALLEHFLYDDNGQPLATSFMDYLLPTVAEMPEVEVLLSEDAPSPLNPLGLKGAGEGGTPACGAAIASAIDDALGRPGTVRSLPVSPERLRDMCKRVSVQVQ